jgi:tripartite-type tricarboxylate transporter receptor subunit TctC
VFFGIVVPAGTPQDVVGKLNAAFAQVLQQPDIRQKLAAQGLEPPPKYTPAQLSDYMRSEAAKWREVIKTSGAKAD